MLALDNIKVRDIESGFMSRKHQFALFNIDNRYVSRQSYVNELLAE